MSETTRFIRNIVEDYLGTREVSEICKALALAEIADSIKKLAAAVEGRKVEEKT